MKKMSFEFDKKVPREKAFYFFTSIGNYTGEKACSLKEFLEKIEKIELKSIEFHLHRGDFEKWFRDVLGQKELAEQITLLRKSDIKGDSLRKELYETILKYSGTV